MKKSKLIKGLICISALLFLCCFFGCSSSSSSSEPEVTVQGTVVDPVIAGSSYTYTTTTGRVITGKANNNGNYRFKLKFNEINELEPLVFTGGFHKTTEEKLKGKLETLIKKGNVKNNVAKTIASYVTTLAVNSGEDKVKKFLGIDVDDLFSFNHTAEASKGSAAGLKVQKLNVQVKNTVEAISSLIVGSAETAANEDDVFDSVMESFSTTISQETFTSFTDNTFINTFVDDAVQSVVTKNITTVSQTKITNVKNETVNFVSAVNKEADDAEASGEDAVAIISKLVSTQIVTTNITTQIVNAASTGSTSAISQISTVTNTVSTVVSQTISQVIQDGLIVVDPDDDDIPSGGTGSSGGTDV